jgi:ATP phosphoribosyltransferase
MSAVNPVARAMARDDGRLKLAVPAKGRMSEPSLRLCADAGLSFEVTERSLIVPCANAPVDLLLVRPSDIPEYVADGVVHAGITGANLLVESETPAEVEILAELGFGRCSLEVAVPEESPYKEIGDLDGRRIATSYMVSAAKLLGGRGVRAELVHVSGSVEATPRLGLADAIVDLVSTGSTIAANGLRRMGVLLSSQAVLIAMPSALDDRAELVERLRLMLSGVVAARRRRYVMMNAHVDDLPAIRSLLPGMGAPTVMPLADDGAIAVHAAVDVNDVWELLPSLKAAGASSILVLPVERLIP